MDPDGDVLPPSPMEEGAPLWNGVHPVEFKQPPSINNNRLRFPSGPSRADHSASILSSNGSGRTISTPLAVILLVLPFQEGGPFGFIYLSINELKDQAAIIAYFDSSGRSVTVLPCQEFDEFLILNSLRTRQVSFINNLPDYIVTMGQHILEKGGHSDEEVGPDLLWLPRSPSISSLSLLSGGPACLASWPNYVTAWGANIHAPCNTSSHPDPNGSEAPNAPILFSMGGSTSGGNFSHLTTGNTYSLWGGSTQRSYIITQRSLATPQHPSSGAYILSSIAGSTLPPSLDSSDSATQAPPMPPVVPAISIAPTTTITIKDKPSNMGIKPITDKDSWTDAKKIIGARLQRASYWLGASKELVTINTNTAASIWWKEVIAFYCQPPVSGLFVEEHCFDGKVSGMITHINRLVRIYF